MPASHFSPWQAPRPCWHCRSFAGVDAGASAARCTLSLGPRIRSQPEQGCSAFEREVGTDNEEWSPLLESVRGVRVWWAKEPPPAPEAVPWSP